MEESQDVSQVQNTIDYTGLINSVIEQNEVLIEQNKQLKDDLNFLRNYFEITEEEQKIIDKENQEKKLQEEKLQKEKEDSFVKYVEDTFPQYTSQLENISSELQKVNENLSSNIEVSQYDINQSYVFFVVFGFSMIILLLYKMLKKFFY